MEHRLFGKQISNVLESSYLGTRTRNLSKIHNKTRGTSINNYQHNKQPYSKRQNRINTFKDKHIYQNINHDKEMTYKEKDLVHKDTTINKDLLINTAVNKDITVNKPTIVEEEISHENQEHKTNKQLSIDSTNKQLVPENFQDCLQFMLNQEKENSQLIDLCTYHTICKDVRGIMVEWLIDLHNKFQMFPSTLFITIVMMDQYLYKNRDITKQNLQLIGTTCFHIAAKYQQTYRVPTLSELIHLSANSFTKQRMLETQAKVMYLFDFDLIFQTPYKFMLPLTAYIKLDPKNVFLVQYLLEIAMMNPKNFYTHKSSLLAISAIYLVCRMRKKMNLWSDELLQYLNYSEKDVRKVGKQLCLLLENIDTLPHTKSLKKKFATSKYYEVSRIRLQRK